MTLASGLGAALTALKTDLTGFARSESIVFTKPDGTTTTAQTCFVQWGGGGAAIVGGRGASAAPSDDLTLFRIAPDTFTVEVSWRFTIDDQAAVVARVTRDPLAIVAGCRLVAGVNWP